MPMVSEVSALSPVIIGSILAAALECVDWYTAVIHSSNTQQLGGAQQRYVSARILLLSTPDMWRTAEFKHDR